MSAEPCDGRCCKNPTGTCYCRHACEFHEEETAETLIHRTMYNDPTGNRAAARADRSRKSKQRTPR